MNDGFDDFLHSLFTDEYIEEIRFSSRYSDLYESYKSGYNRALRDIRNYTMAVRK